MVASVVASFSARECDPRAPRRWEGSNVDQSAEKWKFLSPRDCQEDRWAWLGLYARHWKDITPSLLLSTAIFHNDIACISHVRRAAAFVDTRASDALRTYISIFDTLVRCFSSLEHCDFECLAFVDSRTPPSLL